MKLLNILSVITTSYDFFRSKKKNLESLIYYTVSIICSFLFIFTYLDFSFVDKGFAPDKVVINLLLMALPVMVSFVLVYKIPLAVKEVLENIQVFIIKKIVKRAYLDRDYTNINQVLNGKNNHIHLNFVAKEIFNKNNGDWFEVEKIKFPQAWNGKEEVFKAYKEIFKNDPKINLYDSSNRYYILSEICKDTFIKFEQELNKK